ncbi:hypothetical protein Pst134EA_017240 [Puccinia striiformis f. sp. tritici]|uniref:hypothetical protein n=1 Tax=Puccinia striiformis f. sp. tritici TaxID=168172 RepID=UPI002007BBE4|nr:hypothetical protein Pst134EA_017236 [Puccinia striiformis f. sp. tritici]XP_047803876.1 hypothetical protein Pst134EA_017240 [Puccinia striiformis f. sp. tritici]KAH9450636.1 hypothetical protein Pst134EB_018164 [Puccinia striiformis f. sp. tritici]KAH9460924.1 hypothetical protein Pst134EA_017236 [Puccinia striiformis f. sp. tritici]KAH9460929.1 hypothetical protein Pst134EA_017240 [Puccinia striiformis f. sp. tritici]
MPTRDILVTGVASFFMCLRIYPVTLDQKRLQRLEMVSTIEKVVNQGVSDEDHRPDSWTAVTKDGRRSAQFEETWLKTSNGTEVLDSRAGQEITSSIRGGRFRFLLRLPSCYYLFHLGLSTTSMN